MACVLALWTGRKWRAPKRKYPMNWPKQKEGSICSKYPLNNSNKISSCLKKANQARYEYLFPKRRQLCGSRAGGMTTPCPPNRSCWVSCQFAFVLDLAVSGHAHSAVTLSSPSWKQYSSRKSSPKAIQVPLLALVGRTAHGQTGKPWVTDISLWSLATRRTLWPDVSDSKQRQNHSSVKLVSSWVTQSHKISAFLLFKVCKTFSWC